MKRALSRREFLKAAGWTAGGITVLSGCNAIPVLPSFSEPAAGAELAWVQLSPDGRVRFFCPRAEMGQGVMTSLPMLVAGNWALTGGACEWKPLPSNVYMPTSRSSKTVCP